MWPGVSSPTNPLTKNKFLYTITGEVGATNNLVGSRSKPFTKLIPPSVPKLGTNFPVVAFTQNTMGPTV